VKIRASREMAKADERASAAAARNAELEVALGVERLYYGLLVAQHRRRAAQLRLQVAQETLDDRVRTVSTGAKLEVAALEGRTAALDARQSLLAVDDDIADLSAQLSEMLGSKVDGGTELVVPAREEMPDTLAATQLVGVAMASNPDVEVAGHQLRKAESGLAATRASYIPDVSFFGQAVNQTAVAFLPENNYVFGIKAQWTVFNFGKREADVAEMRAARHTAEENLTRVRRQVASEVEQAERKVQRTARNVALANEVLALRREALRIKADQAGTGLVLASEQHQAEADVATAEADLLAADVDQRLAVAKLRRLVGKTQN
jgi:outer membrane protein TolC